jgi:hypothetical protein
MKKNRGIIWSSFLCFCSANFSYHWLLSLTNPISATAFSFLNLLLETIQYLYLFFSPCCQAIRVFCSRFSSFGQAGIKWNVSTAVTFPTNPLKRRYWKGKAKILLSTLIDNMLRKRKTPLHFKAKVYQTKASTVFFSFFSLSVLSLSVSLSHTHT